MIEIDPWAARARPTVEDQDLVSVGAARVRLTANQIEVLIDAYRQRLGLVEIQVTIAGGRVRLIAGDHSHSSGPEVIAENPAQVLIVVLAEEREVQGAPVGSEHQSARVKLATRVGLS